jgi:hypothetical protein
MCLCTPQKHNWTHGITTKYYCYQIRYEYLKFQKKTRKQSTTTSYTKLKPPKPNKWYQTKAMVPGATSSYMTSYLSTPSPISPFYRVHPPKRASSSCVHSQCAVHIVMGTLRERTVHSRRVPRTQNSSSSSSSDDMAKWLQSIDPHNFYIWV